MLRQLWRELAGLRLVLAAVVPFLRRQWYRTMSLVAAAETTGARLAPGVGAYVLRKALNGNGAPDRRRTAERCPSARAVRARFDSTAMSDLLHANLIVLKSFYGERERGVVLLKYSEVINAFPLLFESQDVQARYHLVLEPSTTGFMQPATWLGRPDLSVIGVETVERSSISGYARLGFVPLDVSDGDWVDEDEFRPVDGVRKTYDFAMIANFIPLKRHEFVFDALKRWWQGDLRFALLASSWVGAGPATAKALLEKYGLTDAADLHFDVSQSEVNRILNASRCHVLASEREGANRACLEALFAGTPALVPAGHVGFPHFRYKQPLVRFFGDGAELVQRIRECRDAPAADAISCAARSVAGARVATRAVTAGMRRACLDRGEAWGHDLTEKVTRVHCCYRDPRAFETHRADYEYLGSATRDGFAYVPARAEQLLTR